MLRAGRRRTAVLAAVAAALAVSGTGPAAPAAAGAVATPSPTSSTGTFSTISAPLTRVVDLTTPIPSCGPGPIGVLDDGTSFYVTDWCNGFTYRYTMGTTLPAPLEKSVNNGLDAGLALDNGVYYGVAGQNQSTVHEGVYIFDPTTLALKSKVVETPCQAPRGLEPDPATGDLLVAADCGLFRVSGPDTAKPVIKRLAPGDFDGVTVVDNGADMWVADRATGGVDEYSAAGALVTSVQIQGDADGVALASTSAPSSIAGNLFVNNNNGTIVMVDVHHHNAQSVIASGGTRGDFVAVGPDGYLYATASDRVEQIQPAIFAPTEEPGGGGSDLWLILLLVALALLALLLLLLWRRRRRDDADEPEAGHVAEPGAAASGAANT